jgi:putative ABC transport system ATP-binding protein
MDAIVQLKDVSKVLRAGDTETHALEGVNLEIPPGGFLAIMGPSGCGKSTLLSLAGLLDQPSSGELVFNGKSTTGMNESQRAALRSSTLGFVFQNFNLIDELTVEDNIQLPLVYAGTPNQARRRRCQEVMDRLGVGHRARHRPSQLSGGQQQRVAIARAIATEPKLILADEPAGNLDSAHGEEVMRLLREIVIDGTSVLMVTHSADHARRADRVLWMHDGRLTAEARK